MATAKVKVAELQNKDKQAYGQSPQRDEQTYVLQQDGLGENNNYSNGISGGGAPAYIPPHERMNKQSDSPHYEMNGNIDDVKAPHDHNTTHNENTTNSPPKNIGKFVPPHLRKGQATQDTGDVGTGTEPAKGDDESRKLASEQDGEQEKKGDSELFLQSVSARVAFFKSQSLTFRPSIKTRAMRAKAAEGGAMSSPPSRNRVLNSQVTAPPQHPSELGQPQVDFQQNGVIQEGAEVAKDVSNLNGEAIPESQGDEAPVAYVATEETEGVFKQVESLDLNKNQEEQVEPNIEEECTQQPPHYPEQDQRVYAGDTNDVQDFNNHVPDTPPQNNYQYVQEVQQHQTKGEDLPEKLVDEEVQGVANSDKQMEYNSPPPPPPAYNGAPPPEPPTTEQPVASAGNSTSEVQNGYNKDYPKKPSDLETTSAARPSSNSSSTSAHNTVQSVPPPNRSPSYPSHFTPPRKTQSHPRNPSPSPSPHPFQGAHPVRPEFGHMPPYPAPPLAMGPPRMVIPGPGPYYQQPGGYVMIQHPGVAYQAQPHPMMQYGVVPQPPHPQQQGVRVPILNPMRMPPGYVYAPPARPQFVRPPPFAQPDTEHPQHMPSPRPPSPNFVPKHDVQYMHPVQQPPHQMSQPTPPPPTPYPPTPNPNPHPPPQPSPSHMYPMFQEGQNQNQSRGEPGFQGGMGSIPPPPSTMGPGARNQSPFQHAPQGYGQGQGQDMDTVSESESQRSGERNGSFSRRGSGRNNFNGARGAYSGRGRGRIGRSDSLGRFPSAPPTSLDKPFSPPYQPSRPPTQPGQQYQYPTRAGSFPTMANPQNIPYMPPPNHPMSPQPRTPRDGPFPPTPHNPMPPPGGDFPPMFMSPMGPGVPQRPGVPQQMGFDEHPPPPYGPGVGVGVGVGGPPQHMMMGARPPPHPAHNMQQAMLMHQQQQQMHQQQQQHQRQQHMQMMPNYNGSVGMQGNEQVLGKQDE